MNSIVIIFLGIIALFLITLAIIFTIKISKYKKRKLDYFAMFVMGIVWLIFGVILGNAILWAIGLIFSIVGVANFNQWKKNRVRWKDLDKKEKKIRMWLMLILIIVLIVGVIGLILVF